VCSANAFLWKAASEASNDSHSNLVDGTDVFALKEQDVEAGLKGQKAEHEAIVSPKTLRCACLKRYV
ncbi:MAG: hypothetical protein WBY67_03505, partial [Pseudolabrys sp.]